MKPSTSHVLRIKMAIGFDAFRTHFVALPEAPRLSVIFERTSGSRALYSLAFLHTKRRVPKSKYGDSFVALGGTYANTSSRYSSLPQEAHYTPQPYTPSLELEPFGKKVPHVHSLSLWLAGGMPSHRVRDLVQILPRVTERDRHVAEVIAVQPQACELSANLG